ncbi:MAG: ABC transporter [Acidobacteria bacterium]|jgi:hypothetical protein|nr:ABC transporter [Acidobacteriota bacterium]MDP7339243.1 DinB family protein [Vicinamibacterales bacterium]HJN46091.1 DinB family protein [Vicinamibacterales bacterium]|tara:strand:- start:31 stop:504 length:474 start_codon:yes stop_codon:yes gene_type:complete
MNNDTVRDLLVDMVGGRGAHVDFETAFADFPKNLRGAKPAGTAHSAWEVLEHMRIAQSDILEFSRDASHVSPEFPGGYWPESVSPPDDAAWTKSIDAFLAGRQAMQDLIADSTTDLLDVFAHGTGQTVFKEAGVIAKHNAYHIGELLVLRRLLGEWG